MNGNKQTGFTLVELMVTLAVAAALTGAAAVSLGPILNKNHMPSYTQEIITTLNLAKSEAITRNTRVTICPRVAATKSDPDAYECLIGTNWQNGWIVFVDLNNDGSSIIKPNVNPTANIIQAHGPLKSGFSLTLNSNINKNISFTPTGFPRAPGASGGGMQNGTILICGPLGYVTHSRKIVLSSSGRIRSMSHIKDKSKYDARGGNKLKSCPSDSETTTPPNTSAPA